MEIEKEIKQAYFKDEIHKLMINLLFTGKWTNTIMANQLKEYKLTTQQYNVLRILRGQKGNQISVNEIAKRMIDKMSNVSRLIDKLKDKKFVERKTNTDDKRQVDIRVTAIGLAIINKIEAKEEEIKMKFSALSNEEAKQLNYLLDKLRG